MKTRRPEKIILRLGKELKDKAFPLGSSSATTQPPLENLVGKTYGFIWYFLLVLFLLSSPFPPFFLLLFLNFSFHVSFWLTLGNWRFNFHLAAPLCGIVVSDSLRKYGDRSGTDRKPPARKVCFIYDEVARTVAASNVYQRLQRWHVSPVTERFAN